MDSSQERENFWSSCQDTHYGFGDGIFVSYSIFNILQNKAVLVFYVQCTKPLTTQRSFSWKEWLPFGPLAAQSRVGAYRSGEDYLPV